jgi:hypothetical protein
MAQATTLHGTSLPENLILSNRMLRYSRWILLCLSIFLLAKPSFAWSQDDNEKQHTHSVVDLHRAEL